MLWFALSERTSAALFACHCLSKVMAPKWTLVVVSSVVTLAVQALESVRARCTSYSRLPRRVRLGIGLATPSQQSVVLNSIRTTDCWLGVARPIPSLTLLGRQLQLVHLVLTLSSV